MTQGTYGFLLAAGIIGGAIYLAMRGQTGGSKHSSPERAR